MTKFNANDFEAHFRSLIQTFIPQGQSNEEITYSLLPSGKLFRAQLLWNFCEDQQVLEQKERFDLAAAIEVHHTYTLIHDDLPAMDNDDLRRGRVSHHKKFNEWKAILAGDGLLNLSYALLAPYSSPLLLKTFSWATGPKGLILGQYLDLENQQTRTFNEILRIHELKTARLMQLCFLLPSIVGQKPFKSKELLRLGSQIGILFQLRDDKNEEMNEEEKKKNAYFLYPEDSQKKYLELLKSLSNYMNKKNLYQSLKQIKEAL